MNPDNDVYGNVAAGSSHYGFWYRALERPDGTGGQANVDAHVQQCPMYTPLARSGGLCRAGGKGARARTGVASAFREPARATVVRTQRRGGVLAALLRPRRAAARRQRIAPSGYSPGKATCLR